MAEVHDEYAVEKSVDFAVPAVNVYDPKYSVALPIPLLFKVTEPDD